VQLSSVENEIKQMGKMNPKGQFVAGLTMMANISPDEPVIRVVPEDASPQPDTST
jgi:hypothetical protein